MNVLFAITLTAAADETIPGGIDAWGPDRVEDVWQPRFDTASDVVLYGNMVGAPLFYGGSQLLGDERDWRPVVSVGVAEIFTFGLTEVVKLGAHRRRPYTWFPGADSANSRDWCTSANASDHDGDCKSFWSGHTSMTAVASYSTAMSIQLTDRPTRWGSVAMFGAATVLTWTTGGLRVAAGKHYPTDVLVGGAVGTLIGLGVPLLAHELFPRR